MSCDACGAERSTPAPVCGACGAVQPVDTSLDAFAVFGLEPAWRLDLDALWAACAERVRALHPDRFLATGGEPLRRARAHTLALNDALRTLTWPRERLAALLVRRGRADRVPEAHAARPDADFRLTLRELSAGLAELDGPDAHVERARIHRETRTLQESLLAEAAALALDPNASLAAVPRTLERVAALDAVLLEARR